MNVNWIINNYKQLFYTKNMRRFTCFCFLVLFSISLFAENSALLTNTSLDSYKYSALDSISYYGKIKDIFLNPSTIVLVDDDKKYSVSEALSESYDLSILSSEKFSYYQNLKNEVQGTVISGNVALSAKFSNALDNRILVENTPYFDYFAGFDVEIGFAYSFFNMLSFGARIGGGNSVSRLYKQSTNIVEIVGNSFFSPYEKMKDSERFNVNFGSLFFYKNYAIALVVDDFVSTSTFSFFDNIIGNTSFGFSYTGNEYNKNGDLQYLIPRFALTIRGIGLEGLDKTVKVQGDLTLQLLKDVLLQFGLAYTREVSKTNEITDSISTTIFVNYADSSLSLNLVYIDGLDKRIQPSITFTYSN